MLIAFQRRGVIGMDLKAGDSLFPEPQKLLSGHHGGTALCRMRLWNRHKGCTDCYCVEVPPILANCAKFLFGAAAAGRCWRVKNGHVQ